MNFIREVYNVKLIVGLGNPGVEYINTRHNVGFMYLDYIFEDKFKFNKKFNAMEYVTVINDEKVLVIKPLSFMNLSGEVVIRYVNFYKIRVEDILVIQDDLDMNIGRYKLLFNHGDGGHNGIKNINHHLGSKNYLRLKIGISKDNNIETKEYVLGKFNKSEIEIINDIFLKLKNFLDDYTMYDYDKLMCKYNIKN